LINWISRSRLGGVFRYSTISGSVPLCRIILPDHRQRIP
jgi:hypothetical protein